MGVTLLVGTDKGGFVIASKDRRAWNIGEPIFKGWRVTAAARTPDGAWLLSTASQVYGPAIHRSRDLRDWTQVERPPAYPQGGKRKMSQIWRIVAHDGVAYAGVDEAGLFRSTDGGSTWQPLDGLNEHPTRDAWHPGNGGLCCHAILIDPRNPQRLWAGISAVGVFRSDDGGATWHSKNAGVQCVLEDKSHPGIGYCVHGLVADPADADRIYRQDHTGMYVTTDGGERWERIENGLESAFGFPIALDRRTGTLFVAPLESDEYRIPKDGKFRMFRSRDRGQSWRPLREGLPQQHAYFLVLRGAMDVDHQDPCGVYLGTTSGDVFVSADAGESWRALPCRLPRVLSMTAVAD